MCEVGETRPVRPATVPDHGLGTETIFGDGARACQKAYVYRLASEENCRTKVKDCARERTEMFDPEAYAPEEP